MNQILVTDKIYDTPLNRKKRRLYKIIFTISVVVIIFLILIYVYGEYQRNRKEAVSKQILKEISFGYATDTMVQEDVLVIGLDVEEEDVQMQTGNIQQVQLTESNKYAVYITENGIQYSVDSILKIPTLDIIYPVLTETSEELLKVSITKFWGGEPNTVGNYCVAGHNYSGSGKMFGKLSRIKMGDIVELQDASGRIVQYAVYNKFIVEPDDVSATSQLTNGKREITLITCANSGTQRLIVKCREVEK